MNTIFDEINSTVVENLSNHPEAFADTRYLKSNAASIEKGKGQVMVVLRFHSVEARHASELRRIRGDKGWITLNQRGSLPPLSQGVYDGEENVIQGGINLVTLTGLPATTVSEAFDEPLTEFQVRANIAPFISQHHHN